MVKILPAGTHSTPRQVFDVKPKKSKKRTRYTVGHRCVEGELSEPITERAGNTSDPVEDIPSLEDRLEDKARKKQARVCSTKPVEDMAQVPLAPEKSKKRKHRVSKNGNQPEGPGEDAYRPESDLSPEEPPKKKRKNRTEFSDPRVDTTLNNQSRKALEYVFTLMNRPSKWKFNKARQNWVIRNVWAPDIISDTYFPLVVKYLNTVQGGSREKLKETCQSYLKIQDSSDATNDSTSKSLGPKTSTTTMGTLTNAKPTPGPLIVSNPDPIPTDTDTTTMATASPTSTAALIKVRHTRAHILFHTLTSDTL